MLDHLTISIIRHRRTYRNFHHQISGFTNAGDSQISINRAMCGLLGAYYKVVGVEANPEMVAILQKRFAAQIANGTFQLIDVGVAEDEGMLDFFV